MERRKFIQMLAILFGGLTYGANTKLVLAQTPSRGGYLIGPRRHRTRTGNRGSSDERRPRRGYFELLDLSTNTARTIPLAHEAHSCLPNPAEPHSFFALAQKPGRFSSRVRFTNDTHETTVFEAGEGRHFYGHGAVDPERGLLFATENTVATGAGVVVVRDLSTLEVVRELPTFGIGPHALSYLPEAHQLVVANSGIHIRPSGQAGYERVRDDYAESSLCVVDLATGKLIKKVGSRDASVAMKHLDHTSGVVAVGSQWKPLGEEDRPKDSLLTILHKGSEVEKGEVIETLYKEMGNHVLSCAISPDASQVALTSPSGDLVTLWSLNDGSFIKKVKLPEPSGAAFSLEGKSLFVSSFTGGLYEVQLPSGRAEVLGSRSASVHGWGSHLTYLA